jgi:hypothetical protein
VTVIPDSIEPYKGYKALDLLDDGRLCSPSQNTIWPARARLEAHCTRGLSEWQWVPKEGEPRSMDATSSTLPTLAYSSGIVSTSTVLVRTAEPRPKPNNPLPPGWAWSWEPLTHDAPQEGCYCGIYVVDNPDDCLHYVNSNSVLVEVALWGLTITAHRGARGQYAYPQRIIVAHQHYKFLRETSLLYGIPVLNPETWCEYDTTL